MTQLSPALLDRISRALLASLVMASLSVASARAQDSLAVSSADSLSAESPATPSAAWVGAAAAAESLGALGFENVTTSDSGGTAIPRVAYEDRRYRHAATELGLVSRALGGGVTVFERRLGLTSAALEIPPDGSLPTHVIYPSEGRFPKPPAGATQRSTRRSLDLLVGPLFAYDLPRLFSDMRTRTELQPELRFNPWPGGLGRIAMVIPLHNDFEPEDLHPDIDRVRPGPMLFEQFGWSPGSALVSASGGIFGANRYGLSFGIARPLRGGEFLIDGQGDVTGFFALTDSGSTYSSLGRWTGFIGMSYRPPRLDLNVRVRAAKFLEQDRGVEVELSRLMGDLEVAFDWQRIRTEGSDGIPPVTVNNGVVKITVPFPPLVRPTGQAIRVLPVERFTFNYHEEAEPIGLYLANVPSREDYLRQLDRSAIGSEPERFEAAREGREYRRRQDQGRSWVSMAGMTGFVNTPWAGVLPDKAVEFGYNKVPKEAAYNYRGQHSNEMYYGTFGFLPHLEAGLRWNVMPGSRPFAEIVPESHYVDRDRMFSIRLELLEAKKNRPGLAIGSEDFHGTRRFHSTYAVLGLPLDIYRLQNRVTLGYAPHVFRASHRTLDGLFGACEVSYLRRLVTAIEYDSEKANASLGLNLGFGFKARAALFDLKHVGMGAGWYRAL
jgi:Exopolysaccharide biosynthesis protein YbjH